MKKWRYFKLNTYLFIESLLWTLIDLTRARRMRLSERMHKRYVKPLEGEPDPNPQEITNNGQEQ